VLSLTSTCRYILAPRSLNGPRPERFGFGVECGFLRSFPFYVINQLLQSSNRLVEQREKPIDEAPLAAVTSADGWQVDDSGQLRPGGLKPYP
jgi:hypothetical protein